MINIVNMTPYDWSDDTNKDVEPMLSVNPANPNEIIATAHTYDNHAGSANPTGQHMNSDGMGLSPLYYSTDGGSTWVLPFVLPSSSTAKYPNHGATARFGGNNAVYAAIAMPDSSPSTIVISRGTATQQVPIPISPVQGYEPIIEATTVLVGDGTGRDRVYVGYNDTTPANMIWGCPTIYQSMNAADPTSFKAVTIDTNSDIESMAAKSEQGGKVRIAIHGGGTIYAAFYHRGSLGWGVVVVKDTNWGNSPQPYQALSPHGAFVASMINTDQASATGTGWNADDRGWDLAIAVDPNRDDHVYLVYSKYDGMSSTYAEGYSLYVMRSPDGGQSWSSAHDAPVKMAKNPGLAINTLGHVGFMYQQFDGTHWVTVFERTTNAWPPPDQPSWEVHKLHQFSPSQYPLAYGMPPLLGRHAGLQAVGKDFCGVFSGDNTPDFAHNFPDFGVTYKRNHSPGASAVLYGNDNLTPISPSIDPFFFRFTTVDPTADVYVRDWTTSQTSRDTGLEPSTNPDFYTTSDVWNQRSNAKAAFNMDDQPINDEAWAVGSNYIYARIFPPSAERSGRQRHRELLSRQLRYGADFRADRRTVRRDVPGVERFRRHKRRMAARSAGFGACLSGGRNFDDRRQGPVTVAGHESTRLFRRDGPPRSQRQ